MDAIKEKFQQNLLLLDTIEADAKGHWGVMSAQNIVEHLGGSIYGSTQGKSGKTVFPPEQTAKMKSRFWTAYYPFPKNVKTPGKSEQPVQAPENRYTSLAEAKEKLKGATRLFFETLEQKPTQTSIHGYFGDLNMEEWLYFHHKHVEHHLTQFGLLPPRDEKITEIEKLLYKTNTKISAEIPATYGKMNAQQMVEHLSLVFILSTGKFKNEYGGTAEAAQQYWTQFQEVEDPWLDVFPPTNYGDPRPARGANMEESKAMLMKSFQKYLAYCEENPEGINSHFFLGNLNVDQWRYVHVKHIKHHLRQFGVEV